MSAYVWRSGENFWVSFCFTIRVRGSNSVSRLDIQLS